VGSPDEFNVSDETPICEVFGWNENLQEINLKTNYGIGFVRTLDLTNCYFPKLQLLNISRGTFRTLKIGKISDFNSKLYEWGYYENKGMYVSSKVGSSISGIRNFYIADIVDKKIYLSNYRTNSDYTNWAKDGDDKRKIHLPIGSKIKFYGTTDNTKDSNTDSPIFNIEFDYVYDFN
jgi:hypothetical protein